MLDVIAAGHLCVDIIPQITDEATAASDSFLAPGRLTEVGGATLSTGGSVSNTGLALHKLGLQVRLLARIGDDFIGNLTRDIVSAHDPALASSLAVGHGEPSSYSVVISPPGIDRTFLHCPGTNNTFGPEDLDDELLRTTRLFHFGYPPLMRRMYSDRGQALETIFKRAKAAGATTSLDMAMPDPTKPMGQVDWREILSKTLPHVDIFLPSVEELLFMLDRQRYDELGRTVGQERMLEALQANEIAHLADLALGLGAQIVVLKCGHRGLYLRTTDQLDNLGRGAPVPQSAWEHRELWSPCFRVQVMSTVGSGDATIAGFLAGMLQGQSAEESLVSGTAVGACKVEAADATSGVRGWPETQQRIRAGWERLEHNQPGPDWVWSPRAGIYIGPNDR